MTMRTPSLTRKTAKTPVLRSQEADQRIDMVMGPVNKVHSPDTSKLITKKDSSGHERTCVLPPWAIDRNTAKCGFCLDVCDRLIHHWLRGRVRSVLDVNGRC